MALGDRVSHTRIRVKKQEDGEGLEVRMSMGEVRANKMMGSEGIKRFLEFHMDAPDDKLVIIDMNTGAIKLEGSEYPESPIPDKTELVN